MSTFLKIVYLLFIVSKFNVVYFYCIRKQVLKSWKDQEHLGEHMGQIV